MKPWILQLLSFVGLWLFLSSAAAAFMILPIIAFTGNDSFYKDYNNPELILISQIAVLFGTVLSGKHLTKTKVSSFFDFQFNQVGVGFALGVFLMGCFVLIQFVFNITTFSQGEFSLGILLSLVFYVLVSLNEELLFRYFLFNHLTKKLNIGYAMGVTSLVFAAAHMGNPHFNWIGFVTTLLFGILLSVIYVRTQSLSIPIGFHFSWNFFQGPIFGYAVSGHQSESLIKIDITGTPSVLNGGNYGAEGSVILIVIGFLCVVFVLRDEKIFGLEIKDRATSSSI